MSFINKEIDGVGDFLGKNENISVIYSQKNTKFRKQKYTYNKYQKNEKEIKNESKNISEIWLVQKYNNCRYKSFITLFYFVYSSYIIKVI